MKLIILFIYLGNPMRSFQWTWFSFSLFRFLIAQFACLIDKLHSLYVYMRILFIALVILKCLSLKRTKVQLILDSINISVRLVSICVQQTTVFWGYDGNCVYLQKSCVVRFWQWGVLQGWILWEGSRSFPHVQESQFQTAIRWTHHWEKLCLSATQW